MWLTDLKIVLPDRIIERGAINIENGKIARIVEGDMRGRGLSVVGLTLLPGLIDLHGDMIEQHIEPRPRAMNPIEPAMIDLDGRLAANGITTAFASISFAWRSSEIRKQENAIAIITTLNRIKPKLLTDCKIHARFEVNNPETVKVLVNLLELKQIDLVSIMDHKPGQGQYSDTNRYVQFLTEWLGFTKEEIAPIYVRMNEKIIAMKEEPRDWAVVQEVVRAARQFGIPIASHDDDTVEKVRDQAEMGVTISEFPVNAEAAQAAHDHKMSVIMGAPNAYRGSSNTGNMSAFDAIKAGLVDILATDYYPAAMLQAAYKLAHEGVLPLNESINLVSANPAKAVGLSDRGRIEVGLNADLILVEEGMYPRVRATLRNGEPIYWDAHMARLSQLQQQVTA